MITLYIFEKFSDEFQDHQERLFETVDGFVDKHVRIKDPNIVDETQFFTSDVVEL